MSNLNEVFSNLCLIMLMLTSRYGAKNIQDLEFFFYKCKIRFGKLTWIAYTVHIWMLYNMYVHISLFCSVHDKSLLSVELTP